MPDNKLLAAKKKATPVVAVNKPKPTIPSPRTEAELNSFANWIPNGDVRQYALDLGRRGLNNTTGMLMGSAPGTKVQNNISSWKPALIQRILATGRARNYTPDQLMLDRENILKATGGVEAINHPLFAKEKDNFWGVVKNIYAERLAQQQPNLVASK